MNNSTLTQSNLINLENNNNQNISMTTIEIAELTGKRHDSVMRDCNVQLEKVCLLDKYKENYIHPQNKQTYKCYRLPKREILILISGYSIELRAKIIDVLLEIEARYIKENYIKLDELISYDKRDKSGYVYFIKDENGNIKIGKSKNPINRVKALQTGNSQKLELIDTVYSDDAYSLEKEFHKLNKNQNIRSEWFNIK